MDFIFTALVVEKDDNYFLYVLDENLIRSNLKNVEEYL